MFKNSKAFSSFSVKDLTKAKEFYGKTLGLKVSEEKEIGILRLPLNGDDHVMIYPKENHKPATYTVLNFLVEDIDKAVEELNKKGVKMEQYKGFKQDKKGISREWGMAITWFTDPSDNVIALIEEK